MPEISDLREKCLWLVVMRANAGENKMKGISEYFTSMGVKNYSSTAYKQHQDVLPESKIKSTLTLARTGMAQSGLARKFWFCAANCGKDCRNVN